jgi:hypothetical protein
LGGFPRSRQCPIHRAASLEDILPEARRLRLDNFGEKMSFTSAVTVASCHFNTQGAARE